MTVTSLGQAVPRLLRRALPNATGYLIKGCGKGVALIFEKRYGRIRGINHSASGYTYTTLSCGQGSQHDATAIFRDVFESEHDGIIE